MFLHIHIRFMVTEIKKSAEEDDQGEGILSLLSSSEMPWTTNSSLSSSPGVNHIHHEEEEETISVQKDARTTTNKVSVHPPKQRIH